MSAPHHLVLVDGSGYIFRAYHALPPLTRSDGTPVGAVFGFTKMLMKLAADAQCEAIAVIFDAGRETFRNQMYDAYKAHRPPPPEDLIPQFPLVREAAIALGLPAVELPGYEADDLIATYACLARAQGMTVTIVSSDKDLMQLIGDGVSMLDPLKNRPIGDAEVREKFGVGPDKVVDVLALIGDTSDNVPGVPGIGPKTAAELIDTFGDVEGVLANLAAITQPKRRAALEENAEKARLSRRLVQLECNAPVPAPLESFAKREADAEKLQTFLLTQGFTTLATGLRAKQSGIAPTPAPSTDAPKDARYELVRDVKALTQWVDRAHKAGLVAIDTETTGLDPLNAELVGVSLAVTPGHAAYIPLGHVTGKPAAAQASLAFDDVPQAKLVEGQIPLVEALALLGPLLADPAVKKIGHNLKYDLQIFANHGLTATHIDDTMLLSYSLDAGRHNHGLDELAALHLNHAMLTFDAVTGTGRSRISFAEVELEKARHYAAEDADITLRLYHLLRGRLIAEKRTRVYETFERPLIPVLVAMERAGITVDPAHLKGLSDFFAGEMETVARKVYAAAGCEFNLGSPKQLGEILFERMGLPGGKKSKLGAYATGVEVLETLAEAGHTVAEDVIAWREVSKLKSTYTDSLPQQIDPRDKRVHTSYSMAVASTGRLSSNQPNLQNIPIRTAAGRRIREAFVAAPGMSLVSADYSQIELRLLAHMADIPTLRAAFANGEDIHAATASDMFGVTRSEVTGELRRRAKTINFGIIYGISAHGLATRLGIGRKEAGDYIRAYFERYPGIRAYMDAQIAHARAHGYVETLYGRRCWLRGIHDKNPSMRSFSERAAINAPLQGTAADIIKRAMVQIHRLLPTLPYPSAMLLQVHDELVFEAPEAHAPALAATMKGVMQDAARLSVPLIVETGVGRHWGEIH